MKTTRAHTATRRIVARIEPFLPPRYVDDVARIVESELVGVYERIDRARDAQRKREARASAVMADEAPHNHGQAE